MEVQVARRTEPSVRFDDPGFVYTPAAGTDIRRLFFKVDPRWPFGMLDPKVVEARRKEAKRVLSESIETAPEARW